ncbi:hypothetical protein H9P43_005540 [Blastocladiella emersonii ATCC 22665]|nr:hypothetical protein H9P43_005540 [Blastocladiella emersonii ATCC 22665]
MQVRHLRTVVNAADGIAKLSAAAWSPNGQKIAIANADRVIVLFDETGERKDKFSTKAADPNAGKNYTVTGLAFSPDSTKLAVAQSDGGVFVYRLGLEWGEKKSICNKFIQPVEVTALVWPKDQHGVLAFATADGKVKLGNLKTNKAATLYQADSYATCLAASMDGNGVASGHANGTLHQFLFDDGRGAPAQTKLAMHPSCPTCIAWTNTAIAVGDVDRTVTLYAPTTGRVMQQFEYGRDPAEGDVTAMASAPTGQSLLVGSLNKLRVYNYSAGKQQWMEVPAVPLTNFCAVTAMAWKPDGARVVLGSVTGALELFDCCLKKTRYKGMFEFTYVSPSQVLVKRLATGARILLKSAYGYEFTKINIFQDQFLVAYTEHTLCLGDLASCKLSEIQWQSAGNDRFHFAYPGVCMMFHAGELLLIEYGVNDILGSCRTEFMSPHLLSVRLNERQSPARAIAYLVDTQTIHIMDLNNSSGNNVAVVHHDTRIDWLELSGKANKLLFRDKRKHLHLLDVVTQESVTLLQFCTYVQWVPNSDVAVAQSRNSLYVWYGIDSPDRVTVHPIKGDVQDIVRADGTTSVLVDEGIATVTYTLDEALIEFGTAMDDLDWGRALALLETLELTPETEVMWRTLSGLAMQHRRLPLAERCFAALGDVAKAMYMHRINDLIDELKARDPTLEDPTSHFLVRAKLAVMEREFKTAERIYLEQGQVQAAMEMYQEMHKWDASIKVAELAHHPDVDHLRQKYFEWLLESGQEEKAAEFREDEADWVGAVNLYLKARMPSRAAMLLKQRNLLGNMELVERTAHALATAKLWDKAGEFYLLLGHKDKALEAYEKGHCFKPAIDLCRTYAPERVIQLEEQWGDFLVSTRQLESAIHHYIEGNQNLKALETAIHVKSWNKAASVADSLDPSDSAVQQYCRTLAHHFQDAGDYARAERYYLKAGQPIEAVQMYNVAGQWDKAHRLAGTVMGADDVYHLYTQLAHEKEVRGAVKEAEKLYLILGEPDLAINMYKNLKDYDKMVELVAVYHKDLLGETHVFLGKTLENAQNYRQAEHHYLQANDWKSAVNMYCSCHLYEDAHRVAKLHGGAYAAKQVAYLWARSLGGEAGAKLLIKHGLLEYAIDFAAENAAFDFAFELCKFANKGKDADVYLKQAMFLEDEGKFAEAEAAFVKAAKPKEAILMHIHNEDWDAAQRVAETHDPPAVPDVLCGRAKVVFGKGDPAAAEALCLQAQRPEAALALYKEAGKWADALRFAKEYVPAKAAAIAAEHDSFLRDRTDANRDELLSTGRMLEQQGDAPRAIEVYLKVTATSPEDAAAHCLPAWVRAAELALKFTPGAKAQSVARAVATKLADAGRPDGAGDVLALAELYRDACEAYARGGCWDKCKQLGRVQPTLQPHIDALYVAHLKRSGAADALVALDVDAACQVLAQRGEWDQCLAAAAAAKDANVMQRHLMLFANAMLAAGSLDKLLARLAQYGAPTTQGFLDLYSMVFSKVLHQQDALAETDPAKLDLALSARELLKKLHGALGGAMPADLRALLFVAHLQYMHAYCRQRASAAGSNASGGAPLLAYAAKHAIALLRYPDRPVPVDRALYVAGTACRDAGAGMDRMAFTLLNRFLDVSDAIEDPSADAVAALAEAPEFDPASTGCDIPRVSVLPRSPAVDEPAREAVRDWVLGVSLERRVVAELDARACEKCSAKVYDAALVCHACACKWEPCIVTGYPVLKNATRCPGCSQPANKDDWNRFVVQEKKCPWCLTAQGLAYSLKG